MEFSKNYLLKYGWEEGQGLGRSKNGIQQAIKPKLKFDKAGLGFDHSHEYTNDWWVKLYNDAAEGIPEHHEHDLTHPNKDKDEDENKITEKQKRKERRRKKKNSDNLFEACNGRTLHKGARHGLSLCGKLKRLELQEEGLFNKGDDQNTSKQSEDMKIGVRCTETVVEESHETITVLHKKRKHRSKNITVCSNGTTNEDITGEIMLLMKKKTKKKKN